MPFACQDGAPADGPVTDQDGSATSTFAQFRFMIYTYSQVGELGNVENTRYPNRRK